MLTKKQISEIREHLSRAQNPLFFFDNDPDGAKKPIKVKTRKIKTEK